MKITLVPSSAAVGEAGNYQFLTTYVVNDALAIDAGSLGLLRPIDDQARVRHVVVTHSHLDHVATLPIFLENVFDGRPDAVTIHATEPVLDALQRDVFNGRLWPDFIGMSRPEAPFLRLETLRPGTPVVLDGLRVTPVPVNHVVPTVGVLVEDDDGTVAFPSDTGPTDAIWDLANAVTNLKAVFLEATFPRKLTWLAEVSKHLTPQLFAAEVRKVRREVALYAVHLKPRYHEQVVEELQALALPNLEILRAGQVYHV